MSGSTSTTNFFLTDGLGSVLGVFSNTAGSAALLSDQLFTPYGTQLLSNGNALSQYTAKGFTGQYNDAVSGLDYYVSRYYDPVAGVFLSADAVQGNVAGMNPYGYVGNNPETDNDPTGRYFAPPGGNGNGNPPPSCTQLNDCQSGSSGGPSYPCGVACVPFPYWNLVPTPKTTIVTAPPIHVIIPSPSWEDFLPKNTTSCGSPAGTQFLCANYHANYALYLYDETGTPLGAVGVPGLFNPFDSFPGGGGGDHYGEGAGSNLADYLSSDETGTASSASVPDDLIENWGGDPPDGWKILDYGADNNPGVTDFEHIDEAGNKLEATLYDDSKELQISWMDSLNQAKNHLPDLVGWLGDRVQTVKGYASDNFATYFSSESRGLILVNRAVSSALEESGFTQGVTETEGNRIWIVFRKR